MTQGMGTFYYGEFDWYVSEILGSFGQMVVFYYRKKSQAIIKSSRKLRIPVKNLRLNLSTEMKVLFTIDIRQV